MGEVGLLPDQFLDMAWVDWQRTAQGYIIRNARHMSGIRKLACFTLLAAGAKSVREIDLFELITDDVKPAKIKPEDKLSAEQIEQIAERYFYRKDRAKKK